MHFNEWIFDKLLKEITGLIDLICFNYSSFFFFTTVFIVCEYHIAQCVLFMSTFLFVQCLENEHFIFNILITS